MFIENIFRNMSNIIDKIQVSGVTYDIGGGGGGGNPTVELTQAEYDALVTAGTVAADTFYVITDAEAGDLTQYWTSAQTQSAITEATSGKASQSDLETVSGQVANKQDLLVSGTNIKTINNESILGSGNIDIQGGGGGKAIEAGRGISITTGETADTVSFNLPISAGTGTYSIVGGKGSSTQGNYSFVFGFNNTCERSTIGAYIFGESNTAKYGCSYTSIGGYSNTATTTQGGHIEGMFNNITNNMECASGRYNVSNKANTTWGDSGNTLFSVGNGTADNARHNAFEIRQNGDIYCSDGTNDVKLQDTITATAANTTALGGLKLVKLTQSTYDALSPNYDSNTLYVIVN
jgi:hypothetical protein